MHKRYIVSLILSSGFFFADSCVFGAQSIISSTTTITDEQTEGDIPFDSGDSKNTLIIESGTTISVDSLNRSGLLLNKPWSEVRNLGVIESKQGSAVYAENNPNDSANLFLFNKGTIRGLSGNSGLESNRNITVFNGDSDTDSVSVATSLISGHSAIYAGSNTSSIIISNLLGGEIIGGGTTAFAIDVQSDNAFVEITNGQHGRNAFTNQSIIRGSGGVFVKNGQLRISNNNAIIESTGSLSALLVEDDSGSISVHNGSSLGNVSLSSIQSDTAPAIRAASVFVLNGSPSTDGQSDSFIYSGSIIESKNSSAIDAYQISVSNYGQIKGKTSALYIHKTSTPSVAHNLSNSIKNYGLIYSETDASISAENDVILSEIHNYGPGIIQSDSDSAISIAFADHIENNGVVYGVGSGSGKEGVIRIKKTNEVSGEVRDVLFKNSGEIISTNAGIDQTYGVYFAEKMRYGQTGSVSFSNSGTIKAKNNINFTGVYAKDNQGAINNFENSGTIKGSGSGGAVEIEGTVYNFSNSGNLIGGDSASYVLKIDNLSSLPDSSGTINPANSVSLSNSGSIIGSKNGISSGSTVSLSSTMSPISFYNSGKIYAYQEGNPQDNLTAIEFNTNKDVELNLSGPGSDIRGDIKGGSGNNTLILSDSGQISTFNNVKILDFDSVEMSSTGSVWRVNAQVGTSLSPVAETSIYQGTMLIDGDFYGSIDIGGVFSDGDPGAFVGGTGSIFGDITVSEYGGIRPGDRKIEGVDGDSIIDSGGTLLVDGGDLIIKKGGFLWIDITGGGYGRVLIRDGDLSIEDGANIYINISDDVSHISPMYEVAKITGTGSININEENVLINGNIETNAAYISFDTYVQPKSLIAMVNLSDTFILDSMNQNQKNMATAFDNIRQIIENESPSSNNKNKEQGINSEYWIDYINSSQKTPKASGVNSSEWGTFISQMFLLSEESASRVMKESSPQIYPHVALSRAQDIEQLTDNIFFHMQKPAAEEFGWQTYSMVNYGWGEMDGGDRADGYEKDRFSIIFGLEKKDHRWIFGFSSAIEKTSVTLVGESQESDGLGAAFNVYGLLGSLNSQKARESWSPYIKGVSGFAFSKSDISRSVSVSDSRQELVEGTMNINQIFGAVEIGYQSPKFSDIVHITPMFKAHTSYINAPELREQSQQASDSIMEVVMQEKDLFYATLTGAVRGDFFIPIDTRHDINFSLTTGSTYRLTDFNESFDFYLENSDLDSESTPSISAQSIQLKPLNFFMKTEAQMIISSAEFSVGYQFSLDSQQQDHQAFLSLGIHF